MIPVAVPSALKNLTQLEEILIACALTVTHGCLKPGGQRGHSGLSINLPQDVTEL